MRTSQIQDLVQQSFAAAAGFSPSTQNVSGLSVQESPEVHTFTFEKTGNFGFAVTVNPDWLTYGLSGPDSLTDLFEEVLSGLVEDELFGVDRPADRPADDQADLFELLLAGV